MDNLQTLKLENGIDIVLLRRSSMKTASIVMLVNAGPIQETKENIGVSHFIEHLLYYRKDKKGKNFSESIESLSGYSGAFTRHNFTKYFINIRSEFINTSLEIIKPLLFNFNFKQEELDKEKGVIIEEINGLSDSISDMLWIEFLKEAYKNQIYNPSIVGDKNSIEILSLKDIQDFYSNFYTLNNIILSVVGDINIEDLKSKIKVMFPSLSKSKSNKFFLPSPFIKEDKMITIEKQDINQVNCLIGFSAPLASDNNHYAMQIISNILGGKRNSLLFNKFIEEGLLYNAHSYYDPYIIGPYLLISFSCDKSKFDSIYESLLNQINKISTKGITESDILNSKNYLKTLYSVSNESNEKMAETLALNKLFNIPLDNYENIIEEVSLNQVNNILKEFFNKNKIVIKLVPKNEK